MTTHLQKLSKAFDRVWHHGLIYKLKKWGITGPLLSWIKDYLSNRYQRVIIDGQNSNWNEIGAGVPQGSVLGPLLFLVFINDIVYVIKHCKIRIFADDTCLFITVDNHEEAAQLLNEDLKSIEAWSKKWLVKFSAPKTESMIFSSKPRNILPRLLFQNCPIAHVNIHKHVGLWFQTNLWWSYHINDISIKCQNRLNLLKIYKYKVSRSTLEKMYFVFIRPLLEYADIVWAGAHDKDLLKLDRLQVEAMRIVTGATKNPALLSYIMILGGLNFVTEEIFTLQQ